LWEKEHNRKAMFFTHFGGKIASTSERFLKEKNCNTLIRYNEAIPIFRKVRTLQETTFETIVSTKKPFGFTTNYKGSKTSFPNSVKLYGNKRIDFVEKSKILRNIDVVDMYKVFMSKAYGAGETFPHQIVNTPIIGEPNSCCTETYLLIGSFATRREAENVAQYISTRFFRFLVLLIKNTQDCMKKVYSFVPLQDFAESWSDEKLYKKYGLTKEEITFIESMIRPMDLSKNGGDDE
jgi:site-specific DNA-methyltransferase (adenine-specific)